MPKATPFKNVAPEYVAVVLASSPGSRLFPVTSSELPKHMMPMAGIPVISRLLTAVAASGFQESVVLLSHEDQVTIPHLKKELVLEGDDSGSKKKGYKISSTKPNLVLESLAGDEKGLMKITILTLDADCQGSIDALRQVEDAAVVPASSNMVVIPGDLVVFDASAFSDLCNTHRKGYQGVSNGAKSIKITTACTVLLVDVGEQDEHGLPLKESAKVSLLVKTTCP
jgi:NDP-sugar pyrophosphorylase family protein